jgi:hypothetical protein
MSQFMLVVVDRDAVLPSLAVHLRPLVTGQSLLLRVAEELLTGEERQLCWFPEDDDGTTDALFTAAQRELIDGTAFTATRLGALLGQLLPVSGRIILWYGDDYRDLPVVHSAEEVFKQLESQLSRDAGEVYLTFARAYP